MLQSVHFLKMLSLHSRQAAVTVVDDATVAVVRHVHQRTTRVYF